jgi:FlaA1/EpsC-like NDP-sugar epimerase
VDIQAGALGQGGEIFVLKMGQPVRIADLARDLIVLSGKEPAEIEVKFTGLRPGEKLYKELVTAGEDVLETGHDKIMVLRSGRDAVGQDETLEALFEAARYFDVEGVRKALAQLVPEYAPSEHLTWSKK